MLLYSCVGFLHKTEEEIWQWHIWHLVCQTSGVYVIRTIQHMCHVSEGFWGASDHCVLVVGLIATHTVNPVYPGSSRLTLYALKADVSVCRGRIQNLCCIARDPRQMQQILPGRISKHEKEKGRKTQWHSSPCTQKTYPPHHVGLRLSCIPYESPLWVILHPPLGEDHVCMWD